MLRIWSWNLNGLDLWDRLDPGVVDVALLQEARLPSQPWPHPMVPDSNGVWRTAGWRPGMWSRRTAVVQVSDAFRIQPRRLASFDSVDNGGLKISRHGTLAAADVEVDGEMVTLVSMYGGWDTSVEGSGLIYADAAAHRLLSDLAGLITDRGSHRIIAAGDLNILHRYGEHGSAYWGDRYASVFDRAEAMGLVFVGPQAPHGRTASTRPAELPDDSDDVPTYHTRTQRPMGATRQLDFVFASEAIADRVAVRALNTDEDEWGPSDHCRIAIELAS